MNAGFPFPWINNIQNAVGTAVNGFARAADDVAESLRGPAHEQQQPETWHQHPPIFPFFFPSPEAAQAPPPQANPQRIPPASARAIRQLPTILVTPEDLVDENNRECCICLEPNNLGEKVTRLPCAHIFHTECIIDWLRNHHCTCPVCRYELPTDDPMYEAGRAERMQARKPRFARYELERMSIKELISLNRGRAVGIGEKKDLIQYLIDQERIDLIPVPEPVEYILEDLKNMRVSELKRAMADAGVFFHAKDVIEKSDMISIFVNSGRLNLLPGDIESNNEERKAVDWQGQTSETSADGHDFLDTNKATLPSRRHLVETVDEISDDEREIRSTSPERLLSPVVMFPSVSSPAESRGDLQMQGNEDVYTSSTWSAISEPPNELQYVSHIHTEQLSQTINDFGSDHHELSDFENSSKIPTTPSGTETQKVAIQQIRASSPGEIFGSNMSIDNDDGPMTNILELQGTTSTNESQATKSQALTIDDLPVVDHTESPVAEALVTQYETLPSVNAGETITTSNIPSVYPLHEYSIAQLFTLGREGGVNLSSCFERSEMVDRLVAAGVTGRARVDLVPATFADWSIYQLRAIALEVNIDLSACSNQSEMIDCILQHANVECPHIRNYLRVISPLTMSSLSQLHATARDWGLDLSDCLEKEEIIQSLITRANQIGMC